MKLVLLFLIMMNFMIYGDTLPKIRLQVLDESVTMGEVFWVNAITETTVPLYGAQLELSFDSQSIEIVDCYPDEKGNQVRLGDFFDCENSYQIQNEANNSNGTIKFMTTLLNPAEPKAGKGILFSVPLIAKNKGEYEIEVKVAKFGTKEGRCFNAHVEEPPLKIVVVSQLFRLFGRFGWIVFTFVAVFLGFWFLFRKMN